MFYRHHIFTVPSAILIGHYLASVCEWTGLDSARVLTTLKGSSPVSCGATVELGRVGEALSDNGIHRADFESGLSARQVFDRLCERGDAVSEAIDAYLSVVGLKLVSGYDVADPCAIELPDLLLKVLWAAAAEARAPATGQTEGDPASVRDAVPARYRAAFDELLADARLINRLRDERGIYNDQWGTGIARWAILEAGRRLARSGYLESADMAVDLTHDEMVSMLAGGRGPTADDISERGRWRRNATLNDVPATLGPPEPAPPSLDQLLEHARLVMRALGTVIAEMSTPEEGNPESFVLGRGVSPGVYEGTARIVHDAGGFERLVEGDVLVTQATSPSFNVVLPLLGAIVTDRGGQLSHAAIVAREYGVPTVVGTRTATARIADGDRVRVDGDSGRVDVL
jgi:pyruvate,water dikinase